MPGATLDLPLHHAWFEADTALPERRFREKRMVLEGVAPLSVVAARFGEGAGEAPADAATTLDSQQRSFDDYFDVRRVEAPPVEALRAAMGVALRKSAADAKAGHHLDFKQEMTLARGLHRLADWAQAPSELPETMPALPRARPDAMRRWKDQHQLFFVIVHGMLYLLHVLEEALQKRHAPVIQAVLEDFTDLMNASGIAFRLTADFETAAYDDLIRPDMTAHDPHFSGLFYAEHKELVTSLRDLRRVPEEFEDELAALRDATNATYEAHAFVCERFVAGTAALASMDASREAPASLRGKYRQRTTTIAGLR